MTTSGAFLASYACVNVALNLLGQSTVLLLLGLVLGRALRRKGVAYESMALRATLVAVIVCPIMSLGLSKAGVPGFSLTLPRPGLAAGEALPAVGRTSAPTDVVPQDLAPTFVQAGPRDPLAGRRPVPPHAASPASPATNETPLSYPAEFPRVTIAAWAEHRLAILYGVLSALWPIIAGVLLFRLVMAHAQVARLRRKATLAASDVMAACDVIAAKMRVRPPALIVSARAKSPCLVGLLRPAIILPEGFSGAGTASADEVLMHELAHLSRRDCLWNLLGQVARAALFFQPALWMLTRRMEEVSEDVVDDYVLHHGADRATYAKRLIHTAEQYRSASCEAIAGAGVVRFRSSLGKRVQRILDASRRLSLHASKGARLGIVTACLVSTMAVALIGLSGGVVTSAPEPETEKQAAPASKSPAKKIADVKPPFVFKIHTVTPGGEPQPGVRIRCRAPREGRGEGEPLFNAVVASDTEGVATFTVTQADLMTDRYIWFSKEDQSYAGNCGVGLSPLDNEYEWTFKVMPSQAYEIRVADEAGRPIPDAKLWLTADHPEFPACENNAFDAMTTVQTDAGGVAMARFAAVPTNIVASAQGYAPAFVRGANLNPDKPLDIRLNAGQRITGKLADTDGNAVQGARIEAKQTNFILSYLDTFLLTGTTDETGEFVLDHALPGAYELRAEISDPDSLLFADPVSAIVSERDAAPVTMVAKKGAVLKGRYVAQDALSLSKRQIFISTAQPTMTNWEVLTQDDGSFAVQLPAGSGGGIDFVGVSGYCIDIQFPNKPPWLGIDRDGVRFQKTPPGVCEGLEVHFLLAAVVSGRVSDDSGAPIPEVNVVTRPGGRIYKTDLDGKYAAEVFPGREVTLEVRDPETQEVVFRSETLRFSEGEVADVNLEVPQSAVQRGAAENTLKGRVLNAEGKPAGAAVVSLGNGSVLPAANCTPDSRASWKGGASRPAYLTADPEGRFAFDMLLPGRTDVWAEHPLFGWGVVASVDTAAADVEITLRPQPEELTFSGRVEQPDGAPCNNAALRLHAQGSVQRTLVAEARTDRQGAFTLKARPPWAHFRFLTLLCLPEDGAIAWKSLPYCSRDDLTIRLKEGSTLAGRVTNRADEPLSGAAVTLYSAKDPDYGWAFFLNGEMTVAAPSATTDSDGQFQLERIPRGSAVSLLAKHPKYGSGTCGNVTVPGMDVPAPAIVLPDGVSVAGAVSYADTKLPAKGVRVMAGAFGGTAAEATTDDDGHYQLDGLNDQQWDLDTSIIIRAESEGTPPEWSGFIRVEKATLAGSHTDGIDIVMDRSLKWRQKEWLSQQGTPAESRFSVAVLNDADPAYNGKAQYDDLLTVYASDGTRKWQRGELNTCQSSSASPVLAWNHHDGSLWAIESVGDRLLKLAGDGSLLLETTMQAGALAEDPKTGDMWILTSAGTIYGEALVVMSPSGKQRKKWDIGAANIAYSAHDDCFWLVGKRVRKVSRDGAILYESRDEFPHVADTVAVNGTDGSVWVGESWHPQVAGSKARILILESDGKLRKEIDQGEASCIVIDEPRSTTWVAISNGLLKFTLDGEMAASVPLPAFSLAVEPDTGYVWVTNRDGVYRLDRDGQSVLHITEPGDSQRWVCVLPSQ